MNEVKRYDHVLPNGYTFLAVTSGFYGAWAKASDPVTAVRNAAKGTGKDKQPHPVRCFYVDSASTWVDDNGAVRFDKALPVTPIGYFIVKGVSVKPLAKGAFNALHSSHDEWMEETQNELGITKCYVTVEEEG